jgi:photosynthetic reaction center H subunit
MRLAPLSQNPEFTFPSGTFDVRGWEVRTLADREKVGEVHDVILDENGQARYLDVDLGLLRKHVLLPIGQAEADASEDAVWVPGMNKDQFEQIPEYDHDIASITADYETGLAGAYTGAYQGEHYYARPEYATDRPRMTGESPRTTARLATLDELDDFAVAEGDPDPRGWEVVVADGLVIGTIDQLIVDTSAMKVRYLECDVDESALGIDEWDRHVLIPVGYARLDESGKRVIVDAISADDVARMPVYDGLPLEREQEEQIHGTFTGRYGQETRYSHPRYNTDRFYAPRRRRGGGGGVL